MPEPLITIVVPSFNQGRFLDHALQSIFSQDMPVEVLVLDGGSADNSVEIIRKWEPHLAWWRSGPDNGQAAAINEGVAKGTAPYVCWLNSDDYYLPGGLKKLWQAIEASPKSPAAYGRCWTMKPNGSKIGPYLTLPFRVWLFANFCFVCQPGTLIRRQAWEAVGGLDTKLHMALDYDLWWRLYRSHGKMRYVRKFVAATVMHPETKTATNRRAHYRESMQVVKTHYGRIPLKWYIFWPVMVTMRSLLNKTI